METDKAYHLMVHNKHSNLCWPLQNLSMNFILKGKQYSLPTTHGSSKGTKGFLKIEMH